MAKAGVPFQGNGCGWTKGQVRTKSQTVCCKQADRPENEVKAEKNTQKKKKKDTKCDAPKYNGRDQRDSSYHSPVARRCEIADKEERLDSSFVQLRRGGVVCVVREHDLRRPNTSSNVREGRHAAGLHCCCPHANSASHLAGEESHVTNDKHHPRRYHARSEPKPQW